QSKADVLVAVANPGDTIFIPAIGPGAGVIVGQIFPRGPVGAVVLSHSSPGALTEVGPPAFPMRFAVAALFQSLVFRRHLSGCFHLRLLEASAVATAGNGRQGRVPAQPGLHSIGVPESAICFT